MPSATKVQTGYLEAVNPFALAPGTASAPTLTFTNASTAGIYSPSVGAVAISSGQTQDALTVLTNGNVGIGNSNPVYKLYVTGDLFVSQNIYQPWSSLRNGIFFDNSYRQGILYSPTDRTLKLFSTSNDSGGNISFFTRLSAGSSDTDYGTEKLRITAGGAIETYAGPLRVFRFGASGNFVSRAANGTLESPTVISASYNIGGHFADGYDGTTYRTIAGTQYVSDGAISSTSSPGYISFVTTPINSVTPTEKVRITSAGSVGIGTTNPGFPLDLRFSGLDSGNDFWGRNVAQLCDATSNVSGLRIATSTVTSGLTHLVAATNNDASQFAFYTYNGSSWGERLRIAPGGNVGIGTTNPIAKLDIRQGSINVSNSGADASASFVASSGGAEILLDATNGYNSVRYRSSGVEKWRVGHVANSDNLVVWSAAFGDKLRFSSNGNVQYLSNNDVFDASNYFFLENNASAFGRIGLVIRGKTIDGNGSPSENDGWNIPSGRSIIRFDAKMTGDTDYDTKFGIQHLMGSATNSTVGDLGILAKSYSTAAPAFIVTGAGNVGVTTSAPAARFHVAGGNIKVDNGYGIDFSATANGAGNAVNSEIFSDYEVGTWTPTIYLGNTEQSYTLDSKGNYAVIGSMINIGFWIGFGAYGASSFPTASTEVFGIGNLPFGISIYQNINMGIARTQNGLSANFTLAAYQRTSIINFCNTAGSFSSWLVNGGLAANQISSNGNVIIVGQLTINTNSWN